MCLPIELLKSFNVWLMVFVLIAAAYLVITGSQCFSVVDQRTDVWSNVLNLIAGISLAIMASFSLCAVKWTNRCLLFISICLIGQAILWAYLASQSAYIGAFLRRDGACQMFQDFPVSFNGKLTVKKMLKDAQMLCTPACPCDWQNSDTYTSEEKKLIFNRFTGLNGKSFRVQQCKKYIEGLEENLAIPTQVMRESARNPVQYIALLNTMTKSSDPHLETLTNLQIFLECTGLCGPLYPGDSLFYKFSHVARGKPKGYCYPMLVSTITELTNFNVALLGVLQLLFCVAWVFQCCICCHPERTQINRKGGKFYDPLQRHED